jgi:hypothetical protein
VHELLVLVLASVLTGYLGIRYWRAMLWAASRQRLSEATRELGEWIASPQGEKSLDVVCALLKVCPRLERGGDRELIVIGVYDRLLRGMEKIWPKRGGDRNAWIAAERRACAYFAALVLDERITRTSQWYAGQVTDSST